MMHSQNAVRQVVAGLVGAVIYGLLYWITSRFPIPAFGVLFRPAVAIPVFLGITYGPWAGLLAGFIGNAVGDVLSSGFFYWNWSVGNALIGMISGYMRIPLNDFATGIGILKAIGWSALSIAVGLLFASLAEIFVSGIDLRTALVDYFPIAFFGHFAGVIVPLPILMIVFAAVVSRRAG
jgi:energy-coupling factor transport system substrate-specific component